MCDLCEFDKLYERQAAHSMGCPYCVARFIAWGQRNAPDPKKLTEECLKQAEFYGLSRDVIRELYRNKNFHAPKPTSSEKSSESEKPKATKRRSARKN